MPDQTTIQNRILHLYRHRHPHPARRIPHSILTGLVRSLLAGELQITTDTPQHWPLSTIVPLLREVLIELRAQESNLQSPISNP